MASVRSLPSAGGSARVRTVALVGALVLLLGLGAVEAGRTVLDLDDRRATAAAERSDTAATAGTYADAFRQFRSQVGERSRFTLVFGEDIDRDQRGFLRLFGGYYLYPAIAVPDAREADAVMVFGAPSDAVRQSFAEIGSVDGVWLGRRPR